MVLNGSQWFSKVLSCFQGFSRGVLSGSHKFSGFSVVLNVYQWFSRVPKGSLSLSVVLRLSQVLSVVLKSFQWLSKVLNGSL